MYITRVGAYNNILKRYTLVLYPPTRRLKLKLLWKIIKNEIKLI